MNKLFPLLLSLLAGVCVLAQSSTTPGVRRQTGTARLPQRLLGNRTQLNRNAQPQPTVDAAAIAQQLESAEKGTNGLPALKFDNAPSDLFIQLYGMVTEKTMLVGPDVPKATISLRSQSDLTREEYLQAIETVLTMHGISFIPNGDKLIQVVPGKDLRTKGVPTDFKAPPGGRYPEEGKRVSRVFTLKAILFDEAQKVIETLKSADGTIQSLDRKNAVLVTDTQENVNRICELLEYIDVPMEVKEEVYVRPIKHAVAADIKTQMEAVVAESQGNTQQKQTSAGQPNRSGAPGISAPRTSIPGVNRPPAANPIVPAALDTLSSDANRGMIRGKVQILADERSNQLIIITRPENMTFFDKIIKVLDIETAPDVRVKIIRLKYASCEGLDGDRGVVDILNELIGGTSSSSSRSSSTGRSGSSSNRSTSRNSTSRSGTSSSSRSSSTSYNTSTSTGNRSTSGNYAPDPDYLAQASARPQPPSSSSSKKVGELSNENITILADPRINAVIIMAPPTDMAVLEDIVAQLDVQLAQVLIETVVLQVELTKEISTGIDWIHQTTHKNHVTLGGIGGGGSQQFPVGDGNGAVSYETFFNAATNALLNAVPGAKYMAVFDNLNLNAIISASKSDNRTKVLSSPIIQTLDNKEATIESTQMRYLYKGVRYSGNYNYGQEVPDYEQRDIGLSITVTPRINPDGTVVLTVDERFETIGANQQVGDDSYPTVNTRSMVADVSVRNGQTVVLGGLVDSTIKKERVGIPILMDIPFIGQYLFGRTVDAEDRKELVVFMTPYVFKNNEEAFEKAKSLKDYLNVPGVLTKDWSQSEIADPVTKKRLLERERIKEAQREDEQEAEEALEKLRIEKLKRLIKEAEKKQNREVISASNQEDSLETLAAKARMLGITLDDVDAAPPANR